MHVFGLLVASVLVFTASAHAQTRIDAISTNFRWLGPNDKIVVERYDDPKVSNVSCYMSRADTGGIKGGLGFAEDPSRFSIACRAVGPISMPAGLRKSEVIGFASASLFFKTFQIHLGGGCRKERVGLHRREYQTDQWLTVQQHQCCAG